MVCYTNCNRRAGMVHARLFPNDADIYLAVKHGVFHFVVFHRVYMFRYGGRVVSKGNVSEAVFVGSKQKPRYITQIKHSINR